MLKSGLGCRLCSSRPGAGAPTAAELRLLLANHCSGGVPSQCLALPFPPCCKGRSEWPTQLQWCCQILKHRDITRHSYLSMSGVVV